MIRYRRLQVCDNRGRWYTDAYAVEDEQGQVLLRYPLSWEHLGSDYNARIRERKLSLEQLENLLKGPRLRWLAVESLALDFAHAVEQLDRECGLVLGSKMGKTRVAA